MNLFNREETVSENINITDIISAGFYTLDLTSSPTCVSTDGKYYFELTSNENGFSIVEGSLKKVEIRKNSNLELEIEGNQLGKWVAWIKWINSDEPTFIPRQFQKKLTSLAEVSTFFDEIHSIKTTEQYQQEVERIISTM